MAVPRLPRDIPSLIDDHVDDEIDKLETSLLVEVRERGKRAAEESAAAIGDQLNDRIRNLEKASAIQSANLAFLRDSSQIAERKVSAAVNEIEQTLAGVVPGFELAPSTVGIHPQFLPEPPAGMVKAERARPGRNGYCPGCTSTDVRRANRKGTFEEFLRLFRIAPFRCRSCRHKFYRF